MDFDPTPGVADQIAPDLRRVLASNPSPMTHRGTNSYLLGADTLAVIDPGPDDPDHLRALLTAIGGARVSHIIVTHSHLDHSPLGAALSQATGAPIYGFGASDTGRSPVMQSLALTGFAGGGEGIDPDFAPDQLLTDGQILTGTGWSLHIRHTPGHMGNHICLGWGDAVFSGDHVMGWSSSLVSPPDGDLTDFMNSLDVLQAMQPRILYPGHGAPVDDPATTIDDLRKHRQTREAQILATLTDSPQTLGQLTTQVYADVPKAMHPAAARNLFAHLIDLHGRDQITATPRLSTNAQFTKRAVVA